MQPFGRDEQAGLDKFGGSESFLLAVNCCCTQRKISPFLFCINVQVHNALGYCYINMDRVS